MRQSDTVTDGWKTEEAVREGMIMLMILEWNEQRVGEGASIIGPGLPDTCGSDQSVPLDQGTPLDQCHHLCVCKERGILS